MCWRSKPGKRSRNDLLTSQTLTEPRSADTHLIITMRVLVKIEGGAKIGTAH